MKEQSQKSECQNCGHEIKQGYIHERIVKGGCRGFYLQPSQKEEEKCKECEEDWYGYCYTCGRDMLDRPKLLAAQAKKSFKEGAEMQKEVVICAAIVTEDGRIFRGHRHSDCFGAWQSAGYKPSANHVEGFITSKNRFVTRVEGRKLQDAAGIPSASRDGYAGNTLYSEDLY